MGWGGGDDGSNGKGNKINLFPGRRQRRGSGGGRRLTKAQQKGKDDRDEEEDTLANRGIKLSPRMSGVLPPLGPAGTHVTAGKTDRQVHRPPPPLPSALRPARNHLHTGDWTGPRLNQHKVVHCAHSRRPVVSVHA